MSHSESALNDKSDADVEREGVSQPDDDAADSVISPAPGAARQPTGDDGVDAVLAELDAVSNGTLDAQIEVGEQVHTVLQGRLADLGQE